jgi:hypothetical protein
MAKAIEYGIRGKSEKNIKYGIVKTGGKAIEYAKIRTPSSDHDRRKETGHAGIPHPTRPPA